MKRFMAALLSVMMVATLFAGCGKKTDEPVAGGKTPAVADVYEAVVKAIGEENLPGLIDGDAAILEQFYGLKEEEVVEYSFHMPMMNVQADEIFIAKVEGGKTEAVEAAIEKRKADLDATWKQYLPAVYEIVQKAQVVKNGDYVMFVVSEHADKAVEAFNEQTK